MLRSYTAYRHAFDCSNALLECTRTELRDRVDDDVMRQRPVFSILVWDRADMSGHDAPGIAAPCSHPRVANVARELCILNASREMRAQRDHDDIMRHGHELPLTRRVHRELHDAVAMPREIVGFRRECHRAQ